MADKNKFRFSIDRGGTFTDIYAEIPAPPGFMTMKLLSEDPDNYADAAVEGIRRIMEKVTGKKLRRNCIDLSQIEWIRMGTTLATNALLERKGARTGLVITKGFGDLLQIGYQNRPDIFDLRIRKPPMLYEAVVEVNERVRVVKSGEVADRAGITGEGIEVLKKPDLAIVQKCFEELYNKGIKSVAVVLMNSYTFPDHEKLIGSLARSMGFEHVSLSHEVMPSVRIVGRGDTTAMDAYLTPKIMEYIASFRQGFCGELQGCKVLFMQSYGGLIEADKFTGARAILSGPAGGVVGYAATCFDQETQQGVIGFDMGGTSTDVSRYSGEYELVHETETAGIRVHAPQMHIVTVAAGGGSRLFYESGRFQVGPESTGAHPGPVCYCKSGDLAITDANLVLGRLNPEFFPKIFGPNHDQPLDKEGAWQVLERLCYKINQDRSDFPPMTVEETALGFIEVANETMARAIRQISVMRGYDIKEHVLACFGGAGGQHACSLARRLGISRVRIHRFAGIMSAYGLGLADVVREIQAPAAQTLNAEAMERLESRFNELEANAVQELQHEGFSASKIQVNRYLNLRYKGTSTAVMIQASDSGYETAFREAHTQEYGFDFKDKAIVIDDIRVRAVGKAKPIERRKIERSSEPPLPAATMKTYFESGWADTKVYLMDNLKAGHRIYGPALVMQNDATIVVEPDCMAEVTDYGDMDIVIPQAKSTNVSTESDPVQLSIFNNLFMSIAEQMGRTLQRTAISTNIKERLDFSCAVFDCQGNLIANAPHIPVHLGSMSEAVKKQIELLGKDLQSGDVIVSNDPNFGGTHLPDITVITPVFVRGEILFFLASRGHHADIGGITPGSIPPLSTTLAEEGVCIRSFKLVKRGVFQEHEIRRILGSAYEAMTSKGKRCISGCRNLEDNISDLKAQVAANNRGLSLLLEMADHYGLDVVEAYMGHIRDNAERAVRQMLQSISLSLGLEEVDTVEATEYLDNGSPLCVRVTLDRRHGNAHFDFTGTGKELEGNLNCPPPVTLSAILYVLRSLVTREIPLNSGCLAPITIFIPPGSFLDPSENAAVVAGNVETSNRIVDCILKALKVAAGSQGTLNNLTFGDETFGYYETIGGGAGAGPDWDGQSGVHTHMSNTRITDPEILERRYPVLLRQFSIRYGSGGNGLHRGGNGLIREIEFLKPMHAAILSERRIYSPYGLNGGAPGQTGKNLLIKNNGIIINIGGKSELDLEKADRLYIATPGGGGFGKVAD